MIDLDITQQNVAVERALAQTSNRRHRYLLQAYLRNRYLELAGRWEEILDPELTVDDSVYRFSLMGKPSSTLHGKSEVGAVYKHWTDTDQYVFYVEDELVSVGDRSRIAMIWRYHDRCRLLGEDVWEFEGPRTFIKLDPGDVLTAKQAGELLAPYIKPLPPFDDSLLPA